MSGVALVTGAASGDGYAVAGVDLRPSEQVDLALVADVVDRDQLLAAAASARSSLGEIDVLVTPAGYYERPPAPMSRTPPRTPSRPRSTSSSLRRGLCPAPPSSAAIATPGGSG